MKRNSIAAVLAALIVVALASGWAAGQSVGSLVSNIPFSFFIQHEQFPAGEYILEPVQHGYLRLRARDGASVIVHVTPNYSRWDRGVKGKLVFHRYGREYFLAQAWIPSADFGMDFKKSRREQETASKVKMQTVTVAVARR